MSVYKPPDLSPGNGQHLWGVFTRSRALGGWLSKQLCGRLLLISKDGLVPTAGPGGEPEPTIRKGFVGIEGVLVLSLS